jgi:uncharacterized BrkB/YihY/UPF0761 family membrane protein
VHALLYTIHHMKGAIRNEATRRPKSHKVLRNVLLAIFAVIGVLGLLLATFSYWVVWTVRDWKWSNFPT